MMKRNLARLLAAGMALSAATAADFALAQSTDQQIQQMEKKLDMNATPDMASLGFQDDLASLEQCQSACEPLIHRMLQKYKSGVDFGANTKLGTGDSAQLAAALASSAATLTKDQAAVVQGEVQKALGADAEAAFAAAYASNVAPYNPQ